MKKNHSRQHTTRLLIGVSLISLSMGLLACGYKDKPVSPQQIVPMPIKDLSYQLSDKGATLSWAYPTETVSGKAVSSISSFDLYRAVVPIESYCDTCPIPFLAPVSLDGGSLPDKGGRTGSYQEPILRPGNMYFYKIRSKTSWWSESADSNVISFLLITPAGAPMGLSAQAVDGKVQLTWKPVQLNQDGSSLAQPVRYQVYRKTGEAGFAKLGAPVETGNFTDAHVINGTQYSYQVRALSVYKEGTVDGGISEAVNATPVDKNAPPAPEKPQVIATDVGVKVFWNHSQAEDLTGYRIYRRSAQEQTAKLVGQVNLPYNMFIDKSAKPGVVYYYSISSVDGEQPANESRRTSEVRSEE